MIFLEETDPISSPMKAQGVGELGNCGAAAAVANAICNATGERVREYPITLDKLLKGLPPVQLEPFGGRPGFKIGPMIQLHYHPSNASFAPHVLLQELGLPFQLQHVDRERGAHKSPDYLKLNPNGLIPVLVDGELVLYETAAICLHLVDAHPRAGLAPALGTPERAHFYKWLVWLTNTLQAALIVYFYPQRLVDDGNSTGAAQVKAHAEAQVGAMLQQLDAQLASHGGHWLLGDRYSAVDPYALMLCRWTRGFSSRPARGYPHLLPYLQRLLERPAVQRAVAAEGLTAPLI